MADDTWTLAQIAALQGQYHGVRELRESQQFVQMLAEVIGKTDARLAGMLFVATHILEYVAATLEQRLPQSLDDFMAFKVPKEEPPS